MNMPKGLQIYKMKMDFPKIGVMMTTTELERLVSSKLSYKKNLEKVIMHIGATCKSC